jgi:hypothetical protein
MVFGCGEKIRGASRESLSYKSYNIGIDLFIVVICELWKVLFLSVGFELATD